jgi:hypothetical protein
MAGDICAVDRMPAQLCEIVCWVAADKVLWNGGCMLCLALSAVHYYSHCAYLASTTTR